MKLDSRILEGKRPLMCFDIEEAEQFIGKNGYFSDCLFKFQNLDDCSKSVLHCVDDKCGDSNDYLFNDGKYYCRFFLPEAYVIPEEPKKKYRPFSLNEFTGLYAIGDVVTYRIKDCEVVEQSMLIGFQSSHDEDIPGNEYVLIGYCRYGLKELFNDYELKYLNHWQPFGIIDESQE